MPERDYDRVELVWPGKRSEVERVRLPFQTIERVNDARRSRDGQAELASPEPMPDGWPNEWRNRLIWGDNKYILSSLLDEFAGKVDLIYIDPPFATGADFSYEVEIGDVTLEKLPGSIEELAYRDTWRDGMGSYCQMMYERLIIANDLLAPTGSIYLHCDDTADAHLRMIMDTIFGTINFRNEISWKKYVGRKNNAKNKFNTQHDLLILYAKSDNATFHGIMLPHSEKEIENEYKYVDEEGRKYRKSRGREYQLQGIEKRIYLDESPGRAVSSLWIEDGLQLNTSSSERVGYPTQKPEALLERIISASSNPGDLVLDFFAGSGTTLAAAEKLGRRWIGADLGRYAIHTARKRLLDIPGCRPFEVQNLGRYERKHWQGANAGEAIGEYYRLILDLYQARSVPGFAGIHGEKAGRMVHVGATDAPVTNAELRAAIEECVDNGFAALDVLGWEWEMGLNPAYKNELAAQYGVDTHLYNIPREVMDKRAVDAGDVHFFELSVAEVAAHVDGREATLELTGFLPALDDYMREKTEGKIARWSDWIDYWSVDYEYDGETFVNQWQAYRTRREPRLALRSDPHAYAPGQYTAVAKVIDIFGNDTTCEIAVTVE